MALTVSDFTKVEEDTGAPRAKMSNKEFFLKHPILYSKFVFIQMLKKTVFLIKLIGHLACSSMKGLHD